jgi:hypothetical protein
MGTLYVRRTTTLVAQLVELILVPFILLGSVSYAPSADSEKSAVREKSAYFRNLQSQASHARPICRVQKSADFSLLNENLAIRKLQILIGNLQI